MATTRYVSPSGSGTGTLESPASVTSAISQANNGDTIYFLNGTYTVNLSLSKTLNLVGESQSGVLLQAPSNSTSATIVLNEGSTGTQIKNMTITGKYTSQILPPPPTPPSTAEFAASNNNSAILITSPNSNAISNLVFEDLEIYYADHGIAFNAPTSNNIMINNCVVRNNYGVGVRIASNVSTCNGFTIKNCTIKENNGSGFACNQSGNDRPNCTNYNIIDTVFENNNRWLANHSDDVTLFGFNGNVQIVRTTIKCNHEEFKALNLSTNNVIRSIGGAGLQLVGFGNGTINPYKASGNLTIQDLTISGTIMKDAIIIDRYTTFGTVTFNNVNIKDSVPNFRGLAHAQLNIANRDNTNFFPINNTKLTTIFVSGGTGNINAGNAMFYDNNDKSVLLDKTNSSDLAKISQQVYDKSDLSSLGRVYTTNNWFVSPTGNASGDGHDSSLPCTYVYALTLCNENSTINFAAGNYTFTSSASGNYVYNTIPIVKNGLTLKGAQAGVSGVDNNGNVRNNGGESVINGPTNGSSFVFLIQADNVTIDGFKTVQSSGNTTRDAFNIRVIPAGLNNIATRSNIVIKNCIVQNLRTSGQSQAIVLGESSTNFNNASNGDAKWENVEVANNYFDASTAGNGYRGIHHGTHFKEVSFKNFYIHDNKFVHSSSITSNRALSVVSYINAPGRGPSYLYSYKVKNNIFNTPSNPAIGGFNDCDGSCEFSNNNFENCKYGISSVNFKEEGGKIENNNFNVSEYAIGFVNNEYATTNGSNVSIKGNSFNDSAKRFMTVDSDNVVLDNLYQDNTISNVSVQKTDTTYQRFGTGDYIPKRTRDVMKSVPVTPVLSNHSAQTSIELVNPSNNGGHLFNIKPIDLQYTSNNGVANAINTGYPGVKLKLDINCVDSNNNPITSFNPPLKLKLNLGSLVDSSVKTVNVQKLDSNGKKVGQPIVATRNGDVFEWEQSSLSTYNVSDPNATMGGAGGDPHVSTIDGKHHLLPNEWQLVKLYEKDNIKVLVKCSHLEDERVEKLHKLDEDRKVISIDKDIHKYVTNLTYMTELSVLKDNEEVLKMDMLNDKVLLHNEESEVKLERVEDDEGLYSLTHKRVYPKQNLSSYLVHLNNNVLKLQVDNFWDDVNYVKLHLFDKENMESYSGEFFGHDENNRIE